MYQIAIEENKMKQVDCKSCTACCSWGDDLSLRVCLSPVDLAKGISGVASPDGKVLIVTDGLGNCGYLDKKERKCKIHNRKPQQCDMFDCRDMLAEISAGGYYLSNVLMAAIYLNKDSLIEGAMMRIVGWMYADACSSLDNGKDYRKVDVPVLLERLRKELEL